MSSSATVFAIFETESEQVDNINVQLENMKAKVVKMCLYVWLVALFVDWISVKNQEGLSNLVLASSSVLLMAFRAF